MFVEQKKLQQKGLWVVKLLSNFLFYLCCTCSDFFLEASHLDHATRRRAISYSRAPTRPTTMSGLLWRLSYPPPPPMCFAFTVHSPWG